MTAPPATARCPKCGRDWPLTPKGILERHQRQQHPVFAKNCTGSRQAPETEEKP